MGTFAPYCLTSWQPSLSFFSRCWHRPSVPSSLVVKGQKLVVHPPQQARPGVTAPAQQTTTTSVSQWGDWTSSTTTVKPTTTSTSASQWGDWTSSTTTVKPTTTTTASQWGDWTR